MMKPSDEQVMPNQLQCAVVVVLLLLSSQDWSDVGLLQKFLICNKVCFSCSGVRDDTLGDR